ncbi:MAG: hypothetical protein HC828_01665 [Blastochloris sp.]|nr:hypothetical protein [Blastochloris sp.]
MDRPYRLVIVALAIVLIAAQIPGRVAAATTLPVPQLLQRIDLSSFAAPGAYFRASAQFGDLNNDGVSKDFIRYVNGRRMQAFTTTGASAQLLWEYEAPVVVPDPPDRYFYKYLVWDIDADGQTEVVGSFPGSSGFIELRVLDGATGIVERSLTTTIPNPVSSDRVREWRIKVTAANMRGLAQPQDIVVLTENNSNGEIYVYDDQLNLLWDTSGDGVRRIYAHYPWVADLDGDGKDELVGTWIFDDDGTRLARLTPPAWEGQDFFYDHIDRAMIGDLDPNRPGIEIALSHEFLNAALLNAAGAPYWSLPTTESDAKITAVGEFNNASSGVEIIYEDPARPAGRDTLDINGNDILRHDDTPTYQVRDGFHIDWDGDRSVDELFVPRNGAVFAPFNLQGSGEDYYKANQVTPTLSGMRIYAYALDFRGDYREEIVVIDDDELLVYGAGGKGPLKQMSPWANPAYSLAIANQMSDNHPERPWFNFRELNAVPLQLTSICNGTWRIRNSNPYSVRYAWDVYGTSEAGGDIAASGDTFFTTTGGSQTVRIFVNGMQVTVKASNPTPCL